MYSRWDLAKKYFHYYINANNGKGHGIHSPFVYSFVKHVLNDKRKFYCCTKIETLRIALSHDKTLLTIEDFGAGSVKGSHKKRSIQSLIKTAVKPKKFSKLFYRLAMHFNAHSIIELGTSLGISTSYFAMAAPHAKVFTLEGASAIADKALENFKKLNLQNIHLVKGNFDDTLAPVLEEMDVIDIGYIDGNHRKEPTLRYFEQLLAKCNEQSILIFDDIHWSNEMENAWNTIKAHPSVTLTIDLFYIGLVFFRKENMIPQHFTVRY